MVVRVLGFDPEYPDEPGQKRRISKGCMASIELMKNLSVSDGASLLAGVFPFPKNKHPPQEDFSLLVNLLLSVLCCLCWGSLSRAMIFLRFILNMSFLGGASQLVCG